MMMTTNILSAILLLCCCANHVQAWSTAPTSFTPSTLHHRRSSIVVPSATLLANIGRSWGTTTALFLADTTAASSSTADEECTDNNASKPRKPKSGDIVTFTLQRFQSTDPNSIVEPHFDTSGTLQLRLNHGNYLPGLHDLLATMTPGETITGSTIDAGYGSYNTQLVFQIDATQLQVDTSLVNVGTMLAMGNGMEVRVTKIEEDGEKLMWTLDGNHPLAGASYEVDVRLDAVEEAPSHWEYYDGDDEKKSSSKYDVATFGLGCFWGGELAYQRLPGVVSTAVGYTQGEKVNPSYEEVCTGSTGHTEAIQVVYDPNVASYRSLLHLTFNRLGDDIYKQNQVGNDRGTQYRSGIYYHDEEQRQIAEELLESYATADREVFTEVKEAKVFYTAEEYHQQYLLKGGQSAKKGASESIRCYG
mmetsp:Transcript_27442/g.42282  ORF Transcript_27442/g.42282 Transcript_27442/m.42282 type:complete len:418 (+) Transcript_27442:75-1328(+)